MPCTVIYSLLLVCIGIRAGLRTSSLCRWRRRPCAPGGRYVTVGGKLFRILRVALFGVLVGLFSSRRLRLLGLVRNKGLDHIIELAVGGKLTCTIESAQYYRLAQHKIEVLS